MVAKDGITQIDAVSKTFTDFFFWKKGLGRHAFFVLFYVSEKLKRLRQKLKQQ